MAEFSCQIAKIQALTSSVSQILLHPVGPHFAYEAGQYVHVLHEDNSISPLSIACAPRKDSALEFHLTHRPDNLPALDLLRLARAKKIWRMEGPFGRCTVSRIKPDRPLVFVARGTGFAPVKALMEALMRLPVYPPLSLYWSVSQPADFYLLDLLAAWARQVPDFTYTLIDQDKDAANPAVLLQKMLLDHADFSSKQVYASGSRPFVYAVFSDLHYRGLETDFFYSDVL